MLAHPTQADLSQVTVVTVTYNSRHCIEALARSVGQTPHLIVVDNASQDGTLAAVRELLPQARCIANPVNRGFGAANNQALQQVKTPFALLLNPDCRISADAIQTLLATAQRYPETAIVAPQLHDAQGRVVINHRWPNVAWRSRGPAADGLCCVGFASAACWLLRLERLEQLPSSGLFDEDFFLYYEDDDVCTRAWLARLPLLLEPAATATHVSRGSVGGSLRARWRSEYWRGYHHAQSKIRYWQRHGAAAHARSGLSLRTRVLLAALLTLPLRLLLPAPSQVARLLGRIVGLLRYRSSPALT